MIKRIECSNEDKLQQALQDPVNKRKAEDEIEIDLTKPIPLSKKQKRLLRRNKITIEELNLKFNIDPASVEQYKKEVGQRSEEFLASCKEGKTDFKKKENKYGIWIGNLSFDTTKEDITKLLVLKTSELEHCNRIFEDSILRIHMPLAQNCGNKIRNKGFCYVDFKMAEQMYSAIKLSESQLNGRNLLIKNSKDFQGRPDKDDLVAISKNRPSRILFVGNLSFDVSDELLKRHFGQFGEIVKVRMATFQDSGKCKGFAFVDFTNERGATNALKDKKCHKIAGRSIRMEYGEDRSKRHVRRKVESSSRDEPFKLPRQNYFTNSTMSEKKKAHARSPFTRESAIDSNRRPKSSVVLASAQRASAAIVPSQGKKKIFD